MSYRWHQETAPMTSLLVLQNALQHCGLKVIDPSQLIEQLRLARNNILEVKNLDQKIAAYEEYMDLIKKCSDTNSLPTSIKLNNYQLSLTNSFRYVVSGYSANYDKTDEQAMQASISKLNDAYKLIAMGLGDEMKDAMASIENLKKEEQKKLRETLNRVVKAEQESYRNSIKDAKDKIFQIIKENAIKEGGYKVKRHIYTTGKNAGREQYVVVKRS